MPVRERIHGEWSSTDKSDYRRETWSVLRYRTARQWLVTPW